MNSEKRQDKMDKVLENKQRNLEIFLDNVHDSHNIAAVLRSCDAVGVLNLYYTNPKDHNYKTHKTITQGAHHWVNKKLIKQNEKIEFLKQKQNNGFQIIATHLEEGAISFREVDYTKPTIIIMGNEKEGISSQITTIADKTILIPMKGMVQSLNVSVATALILYEAQRQLDLNDAYSTPQIPKEERDKIKQEWIYRDTVARRSKGRIKLPKH